MEEEKKEPTLKGPHALQLARELSRLPNGDFHIAFFPYSSSRDKAEPRLRVIKHCKWRTQLPHERFAKTADNYFLFTDSEGKPKTCYRILIRYMAFPPDNYKLHKIDWL